MAPGRRRHRAVRDGRPTRGTFGDYEPAELLSIVDQQAREQEYDLAEGTRQALLSYFTAMERGPSFGNGRTARQTFEAMVEWHAGRVARLAEPSTAELTLLYPVDLPGPHHADAADHPAP